MLSLKLFILLDLACIAYVSAGSPVCYYECGNHGGKCDWCKEDIMCCKKGYKENGCDGIIGCSGYHCCQHPLIKIDNPDDDEPIIKHRRFINGEPIRPKRSHPRYHAIRNYGNEV